MVAHIRESGKMIINTASAPFHVMKIIETISITTKATTKMGKCME